jgi:hypothetical protein
MATINGQTFTRFDSLDDIVSDRQNISAGLWSGGAGTLSSLFTSSVQTSSTGQYYINAYNVATSSLTTTPEVQFAIAYGNKAGSGSLVLNEQYPTRAVYSQYKNVLLTPDDDYFTIDDKNKSHILVMNFNRARIKQKLDPGNWELRIRGSNANIYKLIDNSSVVTTDTIGNSGRVYNIVSGTIASGLAANPEVFGLAYPDVGILIFDPDKINVSASVAANVSASNTNNANHDKFLTAISGAMSAGSGFIARNEEEVASTHYFVRVKNQQFNFSNNPTFVTGTLGDFYHQSMYKNPTVYATTVGLYNDNMELLAVAKMSQPLKKTFNRENLIRIKLDY